jgi:hypothetical protein
MKKIIGIILLSLLFSNVGLAQNITILFSDEKSIHLLTKPTLLSDETFRRGNRAAVSHCKKYKKYAFRSSLGMGKTELERFYKSKGYKIGKGFSRKPQLMYFICSKERISYLPNWAYDSGRNVDWSNYGDSSIANLIRQEEQEKRIAEKPKKKEEPKKKSPKVSLDDNKIVPAGSGSGFFVSQSGTLITNYHVIEGCEINKVFYKGTQSEAKILSIDKVNDIAILQTNINSESAFSVSNEDVSLLEDVIVAGYPLGKQISSAIKTHKGVVTALAGAGDNYSYFQTDAAINQGNSGGPIINQKGNVVGIAVQTWVEEGVQGVHFGIKSSTLKTFASANGIKFLSPNNTELSNKELGQLIIKSTVYVECHMTIAKIKRMIADAENKKALFKNIQ